INLAHRVDVSLAVFDDLGESAGAIIRIDFRAVETFLGRRNTERSRQRVEAGMFPAPLAPLLHGVVNRRVAKPSKGDVPRRFNLVDNRALINEAEIEIQNVVADKEVTLQRQLPKASYDFRLIAFEHLN